MTRAWTNIFTYFYDDRKNGDFPAVSLTAVN